MASCRRRDGAILTIHLIVIPLKNLRERCFLVLFEEADKTTGRADPPPPRRKHAASPRNAKQESRRIAELEADPSETHEYLQSMQEQYEAGHAPATGWRAWQNFGDSADRC